MFRFGMKVLAAAAFLSAGTSAFGVTTWTIDILNSNEPLNAGVPVTPTTSGGAARASFGTGTFTLNDAGTELSMSVDVTGIDFDGTQTPGEANDNLTAAHIHSGGNSFPQNNGVVWGFIGLPFHNTDNDLVLTKHATGAGFNFTATWDAGEGSSTVAQQIANIIAGRAYINFHTTQFTGGEIRGFIPEPASAASCGAVAGLAMLRRRRGR